MRDLQIKLQLTNILYMSLNYTTKDANLRTPEEIRQEFAMRGIAISSWAREMGFSPGLVHQVLAGRLRCVRGQAHQVAVILGLKSGEIGEISDLPFRAKEAEDSGE